MQILKMPIDPSFHHPHPKKPYHLGEDISEDGNRYKIYGIEYRVQNITGSHVV